MSNLKAVSRSVEQIISRVRVQGDRALEFYAKKFDGLSLKASHFRVNRAAMRAAYHRIDPDLRRAMDEAARRIKFFHVHEFKRLNRSWSEESGGIRVGQMGHALESVGAYVPGGRACYPSTVLMTCIPARVAGVKNVVVVSPPKNLKDEILAAAWVAGADACYRVGGPAAVAALAYGTRRIPRVDKIVGPGNVYVTEAKRQLYGAVGIDGLAGPSEIVVWADSRADIAKVAVNLLAQAEHDPDARSVLVSTDAKVLARARAAVPRKFLPQIDFVKVAGAEAAVARINTIAPEHLYLALKNARAFLPKLRTAGAIFLGEDTPVPLGDYSAGPSHVLPTGGSGRFNSGLSVKDFMRWSSVMETRSTRANAAFKAAEILARAEGFHYHAMSLVR